MQENWSARHESKYENIHLAMVRSSATGAHAYDLLPCALLQLWTVDQDNYRKAHPLVSALRDNMVVPDPAAPSECWHN